MHFDIRLVSDETCDVNLSYGLVFIPTPTWVRGCEYIPQYGKGPKYIPGEVSRLIKSEKIGKYLYGHNPKAIIRVDKIGHGTSKDLKDLIFDFNLLISS